jgi:hypothetical protein
MQARVCFGFSIAQQNIKNILRTCLPCNITSDARRQENDATLLADRVEPSAPFAVTELYFAGMNVIYFSLLALRQHCTLNLPQTSLQTNFSW